MTRGVNGVDHRDPEARFFGGDILDFRGELVPVLDGVCMIGYVQHRSDVVVDERAAKLLRIEPRVVRFQPLLRHHCKGDLCHLPDLFFQHHLAEKGIHAFVEALRLRRASEEQNKEDKGGDAEGSVPEEGRTLQAGGFTLATRRTVGQRGVY